MPQTPPPPPYNQITGISRADAKYNEQETLADYNGNARPGELVIDLTSNPPALYVGNNLGQLNAVGGGGGSTTWALLGDKNNASGPTEIALGQEAGNTTAQGLGAIAVGAYAGNDNQGQGAVALGGGSGVTNQGANATALGQSAGITDQGANSVAIGSSAGTTSQAAGSIVINATGLPLENTTADTLVVKPVRNAGNTGLPVGFVQMAYNPTTGEIVYYT
jgi:hypothetical protein